MRLYNKYKNIGMIVLSLFLQKKRTFTQIIQDSDRAVGEDLWNYVTYNKKGNSYYQFG